MGKEFVVGIDLGTTNSCISWVKPDGSFEVIPNQEGNRTTQSIVSFSKTNEVIVGEPAKRQQVLNSDRTITSIKRHMGTDYKVKIDDKEYTPQEISSHILKKLVRDAEEYLGGKITKVVITCPAYFNDAQRQQTKEQGQIAGLEVLRIINEPTQASLSYGLNKKKDEKVLVYDLGGGTFDVSILDIGDDVIQVISTNGDNHLGGDDFDNTIIDYIQNEFKKEHGVDLRQDKQALQRLREQAEKTKIELSSKLESEVNLPFVTATQNGPLHLDIKINRSKLESLVQPLVDKTRQPILDALKDAKLKKEDINEILFVGGMTRMPLVQKFVKGVLDKEPNKGINPDEAVAVGAQLQAGIMTGNSSHDVVLVDVTPLTLGVEVKGGLLEPIIERNSPIPIKKSKTFTTAVDGQPEVTIRVFQGERVMAEHNHGLGSFNLMGIAPAPQGIPQIVVTFDIDTDGIVHVSAKDNATGKEQSIRVSGNGKLSDEEIQKMIDESKQFEEDDKKKREEIVMKNEQDSMVHSIDKQLKENGDKLPDELKTNVESIKNDLKSALEEDNIQRIKILKDQLQEEMMKMGEHIYKNLSPEEQQQMQEQVQEQMKDFKVEDVQPEENREQS